MNNIEKLTQFAQQQSFDDRTTQIFEDVCQDTGIANLAQTTVEQGDRLLKTLKQNEASPEFVKNLLVYSLQKGMPLYVIDHIMNSDMDRDGKTLYQELFVDNTDPFEIDSRPQRIVHSQQLELEL
ncbi:hypothetical protein A6770_32405 [Nostoc minutum NIES-26]|uniref:Uncharacterized protein n=1 Tax=Nostoc minutum NIES-26 TaxID=1844469 RepID=A0A367Q705_9NOSO|nr:hypothetical protein A6770_32405 [Nostoc minutum NIES-26]